MNTAPARPGPESEKEQTTSIRPARRTVLVGAAVALTMMAFGDPPSVDGAEPTAYRLSGLPVRTIATAIRGEPGGQIGLQVLALPRPGVHEGGMVPTDVWVEIDGSSFLDHNRADTPRVEVVLYVLDGDKIVAHTARAFALDVAELGELVWQGGLKVQLTVEVPPGDHRLRALVRNAESTAAGLAEIPLRIVPGAVEPTPRIPVPTTRDAWVGVRNEGQGGWQDGPSVLPVLRIDQAQEVLLDGAWPAESRCTAIIERKGAPPADFRCRVLGSSPDAPVTRPDAPVTRLEVEVPGRVDPGPAGLRIVAGTKRSRLAPVLITNATARAVDLLWTDVRAQIHGPQNPVSSAIAREPQEDAGSRQRRKQRKVAEDYKSALARLSDGLMPARIALEQMEAGALGPGSRKQVEILAEAQRKVTEEIAETQPDALFPVWSLHLSLYEAYRSRKVFALVSHSRRRLEEIAEQVGEGDERAKRRAADMLVVLGGSVQQANLPASSRRFFTRALELDPTHVGALLGLATSFEKYAEYGLALDALERLVAAHPEHPEGNLRLGMNLRRRGNHDAAMAAWEKAASGGVPWVAAIADQEIARTHLAQGDRVTATEVLEGALENAPEQHSTLFLLAHLYDLEGRTKDAFEVLQNAATPAPGVSARFHYDEWPHEPYDEARRSMLSLAEGRAGRLQRALEEIGR